MNVFSSSLQGQFRLTHIQISDLFTNDALQSLMLQPIDSHQQQHQQQQLSSSSSSQLSDEMIPLFG
jgi:hypothetical protein